MSTLQEKFTQAPEIRPSGFPRNLAIIRPVAWVIALVALAGIEYLLWGVGFPHDRNASSWPLAGRLALSCGAGLVVLADILLIGFVYADAKRRGMRHVMWTLLAIFIPDAIGIILYFSAPRTAAFALSRAAATWHEGAFPFVRAAARTCSTRATRATGKSSRGGRTARTAARPCNRNRAPRRKTTGA